MQDMWFVAGAAILAVGLGLGFWRWWPRLEGVSAAARVSLIVSTVGALVGAPFWWADAPASFAWDLPLLASRMLAAAALAFGVSGLIVLQRPSPAGGRLQALLVAVYLVPLAAAALGLHRDRFDPAAAITWGFFAAVLGLGATALVALREPRAATVEPVAAGSFEASYLHAAGVILGLWGLALFIRPDAPWPMIFNWPQDPLTSRLIATMLITLSVALFAARRDRALRLQVHALAASYGLGVSVAAQVNMVASRPFPVFYMLAFGAIWVLSVLMIFKPARIRP